MTRGAVVLAAFAALHGCAASVPFVPPPVPEDAGPRGDAWSGQVLYVPARSSGTHGADTHSGQGRDGGTSDASDANDAAALPGCVPPIRNPLGAACPMGTVDTLVSTGAFGDRLACCPCAATDCSNAACCGDQACAGSTSCAGLLCAPLPASCGGTVSFDCDDFPEDCDEPCCPCRRC